MTVTLERFLLIVLASSSFASPIGALDKLLGMELAGWKQPAGVPVSLPIGEYEGKVNINSPE